MTPDLQRWGFLFGQNQLSLIQENSLLELDLFSLHFVIAIPDQGPFRPDNAPRSVPRSSKSIRAPTRPISESDTFGHSENRGNERAIPVPRVLRYPFVAADYIRLRP